MTALTYLICYVCIALFFVLVITKAKKFMSRPLHIRWELYPVPHEGERAKWGGSYLEESGWWHKARTHSLMGMAIGLAEEMLLLHLTFKHNRDLWMRTYPFHAGIYLCFGSFLLSILALILNGIGILDGLVSGLIAPLGNLVAVIGLAGIVIGAALLLHRRLTNEQLRTYTTPEHYFNLLLFGAWATLALFAYMASPSFFSENVSFLKGLFTFDTSLTFSLGYTVLAILTVAIIAFVPATHMAHFFMKYFTWHNIRWDDAPTLDDKKLNDAIGANLGKKPTWSAGHIAGDGNKTWADIAMHNPAQSADKE